ncbi:MAG: hypothetical protein OSA43_12050, partial [Pirellulales bacterium]|nr:hypothetical protein [Pirellulales bacterium]
MSESASIANFQKAFHLLVIERSRITLAGLPTATTDAGISSVNTEAAPMTVWLPMFASTIDWAPI